MVVFLLLFDIFQCCFDFPFRFHRRYALASTCIRYHDSSPSLQTPPALHFIICLRRTAGSIKRRERTTPAALSATANARNPSHHPPAPLRTLLQLSRRPKSPDHG